MSRVRMIGRERLRDQYGIKVPKHVKGPFPVTHYDPKTELAQIFIPGLGNQSYVVKMTEWTYRHLRYGLYESGVED